LAIVLLCVGEDLTSLADWGRKNRTQLDRFHFFHHESLAPGLLLRSWATAGLPMPRIATFRGQRDLNAPLGRLINRQIEADHDGTARRPPI
jgi:hypothetical protein